MGATGMNEFRPHFVSFYNDYKCEMGKITSGACLVLKYSLRYENEGSLPSAALVSKSMGPLRKSLELLPRVNRILMIPLVKIYDDLLLCRGGLDALVHEHKVKADAIMMSASNSWRVLIVQVKRVAKLYTSQQMQNQNSIVDSFEAVYSNSGEIITKDMKWLQKIVRISATNANASVQTDRAMALSDTSKIFAESKQTGEGYINTYHLRGTFLVAFDEDSNFELKCFAGPRAFDDSVKSVILQKDQLRLARLLDVIEIKRPHDLGCDQTFKLLQMLLEDSETSIPLVKRVLLCSPGVDPDGRIWDIIFSLVERCGWETMSDTIQTIMFGRRNDHRMCLPVFIDQVDFLLKLKQIEDMNAVLFSTKCISTCITDLDSSSNKTLHWVERQKSIAPNVKLESIIKQSDWDERIIRSSLSFYVKNTKDDDMDTAVLLGKIIIRLYALRKDSQALISQFIGGFVTKFLSGFDAGGALEWLTKTSSSQKKADVCENQKTLIACMRLALQHGNQEQLDGLAKKLLSSEEALTALLTAVKSNLICLERFLQDLTNHSLVQHLIPSTRHNWGGRYWTNACPVIHLKMLFRVQPKLAKMVDKKGRLLLHHLVSKDGAPFQALEFVLEKNPSAALTRDPATGMEPFMLAASAGNTAFAHKLLLANPQQVASALTSNECNNSKKRKRKVTL